MSKIIGSKTAYAGWINRIQTPNSVVAEYSGRTGFFGWILREIMADRMAEIRGLLQRGSTAGEPIAADRTEDLQRLDEIRSKAYLDIRRNIV